MRIGVSLPVREMGDDIAAIKDFAQAADELGFTHLRIPDHILRKGAGHLHEPMTLLAYIAAVTNNIELVPSVIILPARQTVIVAKQAAGLDRLSAGRLRLGIGVGRDADEYRALGADFHTRGARCEEQMRLLKLLWTSSSVNFDGRWDQVTDAGLDPLPIQQPIPLWIGCRGNPVPRIRQRIGRQADGWFVLSTPEEFVDIRADVHAAALAAGREASEVGAEAGVAVVGPRQAEWRDRVVGWQQAGLTHLCIRTLGGDLPAAAHLPTLRETAVTLADLPLNFP